MTIIGLIVGPKHDYNRFGRDVCSESRAFKMEWENGTHRSRDKEEFEREAQTLHDTPFHQHQRLAMYSLPHPRASHIGLK